MDDLITLRVPPTVPALAGYGDLDGPGTALPTLCAQTSTLKTQSAPPAAWVLSGSCVPSPASTHFLHNSSKLLSLLIPQLPRLCNGHRVPLGQVKALSYLPSSQQVYRWDFVNIH